MIHGTVAEMIFVFSSDADSDVLADYVLALIRADTSEPELRANAIENLEDFLKDSMPIYNTNCLCPRNQTDNDVLP